MLKVKIIGAAFLVLVAIIMGLVVSNAIKDKQMRNLSERLDTALVEINNLKVKEKVNVESSKSREKLGAAKASVAGIGTKDRANLDYVPDHAILMQLQSDPF